MPRWVPFGCRLPIRVVIGDLLAVLDKTGTLTHKFQAKSRGRVKNSVLVSNADTCNVMSHLVAPGGRPQNVPTAAARQPAAILPIRKLYRMLVPLVGSVLRDPGIDQERNRGAALHKLVCAALPNTPFDDSGRFPDVPSQLLEVKLQTASTIDLGLVCPDSAEQLADSVFHHCDVRYAVFYASAAKSVVRIDALVLSTGADFFTFFQRFEGRVRNSKIQIPLPRDFFG